MLKFKFLGVDGQSLRLRGVLPSIDGYFKKNTGRDCFFIPSLSRTFLEICHMFFYLVALILIFKNSFKAFFFSVLFLNNFRSKTQK